jgi:hypothetical protein
VRAIRSLTISLKTPNNSPPDNRILPGMTEGPTRTKIRLGRSNNSITETGIGTGEIDNVWKWSVNLEM